MSKPKSPQAPDPTATAAAQTASNVQTATSNSYLGNTNQHTPYGNVDYSVTGHEGGVPNWTQTTTLSPEQQHLYDLQTQQSGLLGQLGIDQTNHVADILGTNYDPRRFDTNAVTGGALDINGQLGDYGGDVEARTRELAQRGLGDMYDRGEEALRTKLANQGINAGTDAFGSEMQSFQKGKGDAYASAELAARGQAQSDRAQQLSEVLGQRGTNLGEAQQQYGYDTTADQAARSNPLNEIIALMSGNQVNPINPSQPNTYNIAGTDTAGITQQGYANQMAQYQQQMASRNALLGGLSQLGGAAIAASDPRLKRDKEFIGTDSEGLRWWKFNYVWDDADMPPRVGLMADEVPAYALVEHESGFMLVNYGALGAAWVLH